MPRRIGWAGHLWPRMPLQVQASQFMTNWDSEWKARAGVVLRLSLS